jgi:hypothetical protein
VSPEIALPTLLFDDEFNALSLRTNANPGGTWDTTFAYVPANANGASLVGNGEQEWYINANYGPTAGVTPWTVANGVLTITAAPVDPAIKPLLGYTDPSLPALGSYNYTSGVITSAHSFSHEYGYFEMRAELPAGQGLWPAFWLLPTSGAWPPEIDVMEVLGNDPPSSSRPSTPRRPARTPRRDRHLRRRHLGWLPHLRGRLGSRQHHLLLRRQGGLPDADSGRHAPADVHARQPRGRRLLARQRQRLHALPGADADRLHPGLRRQPQPAARRPSRPPAQASASPARRWAPPATTPWSLRSRVTTP